MVGLRGFCIVANPAAPGRLLVPATSGNEPAPRLRLLDCCSRTIWAARQARAARPLWSESGGRGVVSDLSGGEQPTARSERRVDLRAALGQDAEWPLALAGPAMPDGTNAIHGHPRASRPSVSGVPPRGLEMCLAQPDSAPITRFSGIAVVDRQYAGADRREP